MSARRAGTVAVKRGPALALLALAAAGPAHGVQATATWHVDRGAPQGGDGSVEAPLSSLEEAEARSGNGDTILLRSSPGDKPERGIRLKPGQTLASAGFSVEDPAAEQAFVRAESPEGIVLAPRCRVLGIAIQAPAGSALVGRDLEEVELRSLHVRGAAAHGLLLQGAKGVVIEDVEIDGTGLEGIRAGAVSELTLRRSAVRAAVGSGILLTDMVGRVSLEEVSVEGASAAGIVLGAARSGDLDARILGTNVTRSGGDGLVATLNGNIRARLLISRSRFLENRSQGVAVRLSSHAGGRAVLMDNLFDGNAVAIGLVHDGVDQTLAFSLEGNDIRPQIGGSGTAVSLYLGGASGPSSRLVGTIRSNSIGSESRAASGSQVGWGIDLTASGAGTLIALVEGNTVRRVASASAMNIASTSHSGRLDVTLRSNDLAVDRSSELALYGLEVNAGTTPADRGTVCLSLEDNRLLGSAGLSGLRLQTVAGSPTVLVEGYRGASNDSRTIAAYLARTQRAISPPPSVEVGAGQVAAAEQPCSLP